MERIVKLTRQRLQEALDYSPETGVFVWKIRRQGCRLGQRAGGVDPNGYRYIRIDGEDFLAQRLAWLWVHGVWPSAILRFQNGSPDDASIDNLREGFTLSRKIDWKSSEEVASYQAEYRYKRRHIARDRELQRSFGIDQAEFNRMLAAQNGACSICEKPERRKAKSGQVRQMAVDHNHDTGAVRSLLCSDCNQMIGFACDDPDLLVKAAEYIKQHRGSPWSTSTMIETLGVH